MDHFNQKFPWTISDENGEELLSGEPLYRRIYEDCIYEGYQNENVNEANGSGAIIAIGDADFADYICLDISSYCYSLELFRSLGGQADQASFVIGNQTFEYTDGSGGSYNSNFSNSALEIVV